MTTQANCIRKTRTAMRSLYAAASQFQDALLAFEDSMRTIDDEALDLTEDWDLWPWVEKVGRSEIWHDWTEGDDHFVAVDQLMDACARVMARTEEAPAAPPAPAKRKGKGKGKR